MRLTDEQIELYSRQIILREVGGTGQAQLRAARVRVLSDLAAAETCISYLVGAGVGTVVVDAPGAAHHDARELALPSPGRRTTDASVVEDVGADGDGPGADREAPARPPADVVDVLLDLRVRRPVADVAARARGVSAVRTRLGSAVLRADVRGGLQLVLLPQGTGCPACVHVAGSSHGAGHPGPDIIALASAGALAALTCSRWLLGLGDDRAARALVLAPRAAVWTEHGPPARTACPRGCPPPAHPV